MLKGFLSRILCRCNSVKDLDQVGYTLETLTTALHQKSSNLNPIRPVLMLILKTLFYFMYDVDAFSKERNGTVATQVKTKWSINKTLLEKPITGLQSQYDAGTEKTGHPDLNHCCRTDIQD